MGVESDWFLFYSIFFFLTSPSFVGSTRDTRGLGVKCSYLVSRRALTVLKKV